MSDGTGANANASGGAAPAVADATLKSDAQKQDAQKQDAQKQEAMQADAPVALVLPKDSLIDQGEVETIAAQAKQLGLDAAGAQALLEHTHAARAAQVKRQADAWNAQAKGWTEACRKDPEIGGTPEQFAANAEKAKNVIAAYGSDQLRALLEETGMGNHPEVVRFFVRLAKAAGEDRFHGGGDAPPAKPKNLQDALYGASV